MKNWVIGAILVLAIVAAYYFFTASREAEPEVVAPPPVAVVEQAEISAEPEDDRKSAGAAEPVRQLEPVDVVEEVPLPMLSESDPVVLESLDDLLGEPAVVRYVVGDNVISRVVATIDMLGSRQVPGVVQAVQGPGGDFEVMVNDAPSKVVRNPEGDPIPQFVIDPTNYQRYTPYVDLLVAADTSNLIANYRRMSPLFQEAYQQMGYPDGDFNSRMNDIIDELLATPNVTDPVELIKPEAFYLYADPDLEALSAGQKILVRMGNENASRVKAKLREIKSAL